MRKEYVLAALILTICGVFANGQAKPKPSASPEVDCDKDVRIFTGLYVNQQFGYSIEIPTGRNAVGVGCWGHSVSIPLWSFSPTDSKSPGQPPSISVYGGFNIHNDPGPQPKVSLDDELRNAIESRKRSLVENWRPRAENVQLLSSGIAKLGKYKSRTYTLRYKLREEILYEEEIFTEIGGTTYSVMLICSDVNRDSYREEFLKVAASWKVVKAKFSK